jgi:small subunit ribosomal protein S17
MSDETTNETPNDEALETEVETPVEATIETPAETVAETPAPAVVERAAEPKADTKVEAKADPKVAAKTESKTDESDDSRPNPRKVREGIVISDKMDLTLVVAVNERVRHARYGKTVQRTKKLYVHDEKNEAKVGDKVRVQETRPLSKLKRWRLTEIVERAR